MLSCSTAWPQAYWSACITRIFPFSIVTQIPVIFSGIKLNYLPLIQLREKPSLRLDLIIAYKHLEGRCKDNRGSFQWQPMLGAEAMGTARAKKVPLNISNHFQDEWALAKAAQRLWTRPPSRYSTVVCQMRTLASPSPAAPTSNPHKKLLAT